MSTCAVCGLDTHSVDLRDPWDVYPLSFNGVKVDLCINCVGDLAQILVDSYVVNVEDILKNMWFRKCAIVPAESSC